MIKTIVFLKTILLLFLLFLTCLSCGGGGGNSGGDSGEDSESINPTSVPIQTGRWAGTSDFGRIELMLVSGSTNLQSCTINFTGYICGTLIFHSSESKTWDPLLLIEDRYLNFEIDLGDTPERYISIDGNFDDTGNALSGNFELNTGTESCNGTWSAAPGVDLTDTVIEWDDTSGITIAYEYSSGLLVALKFYCRFIVTEGSDNIRLDAKIIDVDNNVFDEDSEQFEVVASQAYTATTRVTLGGQGDCGQYQNVFVMSSPSASTARIIQINECYSVFHVTSITLEPNT